MDLPRCQSPALEQVEHFWSMLDEMSRNRPAAYKTFMERQLRDGAQYFSRPQPHLGLRTTIQREEAVLYVNVCGWRRVPAPAAPDQPVPVCGGRLESVPGKNENYSVVEVAFNPEVLRAAETSTKDREQINLLALSFIQQEHKLNLSQHYTVTNAKLKGSVQDLTRRLVSPHQSGCSTANPQTQPAPSLLQQICSLRKEAGPTDECTAELKPGREAERARPGLVEVISSTEAVWPCQPQHRLTVCPESGASRRTLQLRVVLPGVRTVSQCQLSITQVDVLLEVPDMYYLHLRFPEAVDENTCCATFNKKKRVLIVTVSAL